MPNVGVGVPGVKVGVAVAVGVLVCVRLRVGAGEGRRERRQRRAPVAILLQGGAAGWRVHVQIAGAARARRLQWHVREEDRLVPLKSLLLVLKLTSLSTRRRAEAYQLGRQGGVYAAVQVEHNDAVWTDAIGIELQGNAQVRAVPVHAAHAEDV